MWGPLQLCFCGWWIFSRVFPALVLLRAECHPALTGNQAKFQAPISGLYSAMADGTRHQRAATEDAYWGYSGIYGPDKGWASVYPECRERNQSPVNIVDQDTQVSPEYQELTLEGFDTESSNKTSMKNTGKTVAIMLKDDYFVQGAGLPGKFKAEKLEFHWGPSNGSQGSEHSINGWRYPVEMQVYMYNSDDFDSLSAALREKRIIAAMAVFFQVGGRGNPAVDPIIHGLRGVVHHEKETDLEPFVLKDLMPSSLGRYYRYTGSLTSPPCSKVVEWIIFSRPIYVSYKQLESFYSIFTTEQHDHVKSVEYLHSNFRPIQNLDNRLVFKSAVKEAWLPDQTDDGSGPYATEASKICSSAPINMKVQHVNSSALVVRWARPEVNYHPPILHFLVSYSWTSHDDSYEEMHLTDAKHKLEAVISPVSPDVLYLFRVQAVCMNDMRSDFSQSMLFRANTTRIFEGTRIVKTGIPTMSPASSADMAPISSGSSTWTSSGIPFSFVSMATGIGPSTSGSQATVASVLTSTLLAGLGFSSGVVSSFPSFVWSNRVPSHSPTSTHHTIAPFEPNEYTTTSATTVTASHAGGEDKEYRNGQGEDGKREGEDKEDEEKEEGEDKKKGKKGSQHRAGKKDSGTLVNELLSQTMVSTAKTKKQTWPNPAKLPSGVEDQIDHTHNTLDSSHTNLTDVRDKPTAFISSTDPIVTLRPRRGGCKKWPFSIHTVHPSAVSLLTQQARHRPSNGLGRVEPLTSLTVISALTLLCLILLLALLISWRHCVNNAHFYVEDSSSSRMIPSETIPVIAIPGDMKSVTVKKFIKNISEIYSSDQLRFSEDFEEIQWCTADMMTTSENSNNTENKHKNRYINIIAYDHSRVRLRQLSGKDSKHTDYINGNYVDGGKENHKSWAFSKWMMLQYHNTQWPDMGVPEYTLPILTFVCRSSAPKIHDIGPMFINCSVLRYSTRVGQTGTYIIINIMLQEIKDKSTVNALNFLEHMCIQRNYLFQTEEQYVFIHNDLMEATLGKKTEVGANQLHRYFINITTPQYNAKTRLEKLFNLIMQCNAGFMECFNAQKEYNKEKNRNWSVVPSEQATVDLAPLPGIKCTGFINASYIMGFYRTNECRITQLPLPYTKNNLWRIIWNHNAQIIVMLPANNERHLQELELQLSFSEIAVSSNHRQMFETHCSLTLRFGAVSAGMPCVLTTLSQQLEQLEHKTSVDVHQVNQIITLIRPGVFTNLLVTAGPTGAIPVPIQSSSQPCLDVGEFLDISGLLAMNINGAMASMSNQPDQARSMESLV